MLCFQINIVVFTHTIHNNNFIQNDSDPTNAGYSNDIIIQNNMTLIMSSVWAYSMCVCILGCTF